MPELVQLQEERGDDVRVVAVSMDHVAPIGNPKDAAAIGSFAAARGFGALDVVLYTGDPVALGTAPWDLPSGLPFTLVLGADGDVAARHLGPGDAETFAALVDTALGR